MSSTTVQAIKRSIYQNEDFIDEIQVKMKRIQEQILTLEALLKKFADFQEQFEESMWKRKSKFYLYAGEGNRNQISLRYIRGMKELLDGTEVDNVCEGLWEAERRIRERKSELEQKHDEYESQLLFHMKRKDYWWQQLSMTMLEEV